MDLRRHLKPLTGEADWPVWKRKLRYHEGATEVINDKLTKPEALDVAAEKSEKKKFKELFDLYWKVNSYAKSMIASTVTDAVYQKIMDKGLKKNSLWSLGVPKEQF